MGFLEIFLTAWSVIGLICSILYVKKHERFKTYQDILAVTLFGGPIIFAISVAVHFGKLLIFVYEGVDDLIDFLVR